MPSHELKTGVMLLAAGQGKRFGGGKLTAEFRGRPLWEWAAEASENARFTERVMVVGMEGSIKARRGWRTIKNPAAAEGMGTSIAAAIRVLTDCEYVVVVLADMPFISSTLLGRLAATQKVAFSRYGDGNAGCPAGFPREVFPLLASLTGDRGAKSLNFANVELIDPLHQTELVDIDTAEDLKRLNFPA